MVEPDRQLPGGFIYEGPWPRPEATVGMSPADYRRLLARDMQLPEGTMDEIKGRISRFEEQLKVMEAEHSTLPAAARTLALGRERKKELTEKIAAHKQSLDNFKNILGDIEKQFGKASEQRKFSAKQRAQKMTESERKLANEKRRELGEEYHDYLLENATAYLQRELTEQEKSQVQRIAQREHTSWRFDRGFDEPSADRRSRHEAIRRIARTRRERLIGDVIRKEEPSDISDWAERILRSDPETGMGFTRTFKDFAGDQLNYGDIEIPRDIIERTGGLLEAMRREQLTPRELVSGPRQIDDLASVIAESELPRLEDISPEITEQIIAQIKTSIGNMLGKPAGHIPDRVAMEAMGDFIDAMVVQDYQVTDNMLLRYAKLVWPVSPEEEALQREDSPAWQRVSGFLNSNEFMDVYQKAQAELDPRMAWDQWLIDNNASHKMTLKMEKYFDRWQTMYIESPEEIGLTAHLDKFIKPHTDFETGVIGNMEKRVLADQLESALRASGKMTPGADPLYVSHARGAALNLLKDQMNSARIIAQDDGLLGDEVQDAEDEAFRKFIAEFPSEEDFLVGQQGRNATFLQLAMERGADLDTVTRIINGAIPRTDEELAISNAWKHANIQTGLANLGGGTPDPLEFYNQTRMALDTNPDPDAYTQSLFSHLPRAVRPLELTGEVTLPTGAEWGTGTKGRMADEIADDRVAQEQQRREQAGETPMTVAERNEFRASAYTSAIGGIAPPTVTIGVPEGVTQQALAQSGAPPEAFQGEIGGIAAKALTEQLQRYQAEAESSAEADILEMHTTGQEVTAETRKQLVAEHMAAIRQRETPPPGEPADDDDDDDEPFYLPEREEFLTKRQRPLPGKAPRRLGGAVR